MAPRSDRSAYAYGGAWALVELHARHLRTFLDAWRRAKDAGVALPASEDPDCQSLDTLLRHVVGAARGYLAWVCKVLEQPAPAIEPVPEDLSSAPGPYVERLLLAWDQPLRTLTQRAADRGVYPSSWGTEYCVDAMLEHAVMHPIRHTFQLEGLLAAA